MKPYQPSNGTEGSYFMEDFCFHCIHCDPDPEGEKQCEILCDTMVFNIGDKEYPKEWIYDSLGKPTCTAYVNWNWGEDGDPDDPDNPKAPIVPDPNQKDMFPLYPNETQYARKNNKKVPETINGQT